MYVNKKEAFTHLVQVNIRLKLFIYSTAVPWQHTHSSRHTHTHTGSDQRWRLHTLYFILAAAAERRACAQTWWTGRWNVPARQPMSVALAQTFRVWRTPGIPLTQEAGGACELNITDNDSGAHVGLLLNEKMLKIEEVWRRSRFVSGNVGIARAFSGTHQETPVGLLREMGFLFSWNSQKYPRYQPSEVLKGNKKYPKNSN